MATNLNRVAAIYDIHGNLPALEAVLEDIRREHVDLIVVGGDVVPGPMPRETIAWLLEVDIPTQFIYGNGEQAVLACMAGREPAAPPQHRPLLQWVAEQLAPAHEQLFREWPLTLTLDVHGLGQVLCCHATPRSDTEMFTRLTPEDRIRPAFAGIAAPVVICGHTHMQFDRTIGDTRVINAGSVGMPFGEPGAYWLLLGPGVELRHTSYDLVKAAERVGAAAYPQAQQFAAGNILKPPSEAAMLEAFTS